MWIELLLLLFILWLFYHSFQSGKNKGDLLQKEDSRLLLLIKKRLETIAETAHMTLPRQFQVQETNQHPYTKDKSIIYLPLKKANSNAHDLNNIMHVSVHELAHVLSPSRDTQTHGPVFLAIEEQLKKIASELGFLDLQRPVSEEYPCAE